MKPLESSYSNVPDGDVYKRGSLKKSIILAFEEGGREVREFLLQRQKFMTHAHNSSIQDKKKLDVKKDLHQAQVTAPQACPSVCLSAGQGARSPVLKPLHTRSSRARGASTSILSCLFSHYYHARDDFSFEFQNYFGFVSLGVNTGSPNDKTDHF